MAVTGQFGKAITGSGSLASAVQGIASDYMNLRMDRIYDAFINKTIFEGREMTATVANELLNQMLKNTQKGGKMEMDIQQMSRAIRKAQRVRTLNDLDAVLTDKGTSGDFANKVRVIREMLLDPRLNPDEITALKKELDTATTQMLSAAITQYDARGKITVNGKEYLSASGASDQIKALYDAAITSSPETASKLAQLRAEAAVNMAISDANHAWSDKTLKTDSQKLAARREQLKILRAALDEIKSTPYAGSERAQALQDGIQSYTDQEKILSDKIGSEAAGKRFAGADQKIFGAIDALETKMREYSSISSLMTGSNGGNVSLWTLMAYNPNMATYVIEEYARQSGQSTISVGGQIVDLTAEGLYNLGMDTKADAKSVYMWSKNNRYLSEQEKASIKNVWDAARAVTSGAPNLRLEDKYDTITEKLTDALEGASANLSDRVEALRAAGKELMTLAEMSNLGPSERAQIENEARLYLGGEGYNAAIGTYGNSSGNFADGSSTADYLGSLIFGDTIGTQVGIVDAVGKIYGDSSEWENDNGVIYTDAFGNSKATSRGAAAPSFENGQGMEVTTVSEHTYNGTRIQKETANVVQRMRIVLSGAGGDTSKLNENTVGWIAQLPNGEWVVFSQDAAGVQRLLNKQDSDAIRNELFPNGITIRSIGGQNVTVLGDGGAARLRGFSGTTIANTKLLDGSIMSLLTTAGYSLNGDNEQAIHDSIDAAVRSGKLKIINGRAVIIGGIRGSENIDITDRLGVIGLKWVKDNMDAMSGEGYGIPSPAGPKPSESVIPPGTAATNDNPWVRSSSGIIENLPNLLPKPEPQGQGSSGTDAGDSGNGRSGSGWGAGRRVITPERTPTGAVGPQASNAAIIRAGFVSRAHAGDEGAMSRGLLRGFMRNMPTATGASLGFPTKPPTDTTTARREFEDIPRRTI